MQEVTSSILVAARSGFLTFFSHPLNSQRRGESIATIWSEVDWEIAEKLVIEQFE